MVPARALLFVAITGFTIGGCPKPAPPPPPKRDPAHPTALGNFMKKELNPPFSKFSFLLFHDEGDPTEGAGTLPDVAVQLSAAAGKLASWPEPFGDSEQSRQVFAEYARSLQSDADRIGGLLREAKRDDAKRLFEELRHKCDACHHFFRYDDIVSALD